MPELSLDTPPKHLLPPLLCWLVYAYVVGNPDFCCSPVQYNIKIPFLKTLLKRYSFSVVLNDIKSVSLPTKSYFLNKGVFDPQHEL